MGLQHIIALAALAASASAYYSCPTLFNFYPDVNDCTKFYRCFWGKPVPFNCPLGTRWSQHLLTCDHAYNVPCGNYPAVPYTDKAHTPLVPHQEYHPTHVDHPATTDYTPYQNKGSDYTPYQNKGSDYTPYQNKGSDYVPYQNQGSDYAPYQNQGSDYAPYQNQGSDYAPYQNKGSDYTPYPTAPADYRYGSEPLNMYEVYPAKSDYDSRGSYHSGAGNRFRAGYGYQ